jgi:hypothetical protein
MNADNRAALGVTDEKDLNTLRFDVDRLVAREEARHEHRVREEELRKELRKADDEWRLRTSNRIDRVQKTTEKLHDQIDNLPDRINGQLQESREAQAKVLAEAAKHAAEAVAIAAALAAKEHDRTIGAESVKKALTKSTRWIISMLVVVFVGIVVATQLSLSKPGDDRIPVLTGTIVAAIAVLSFVWYQGRSNS